MNTLAGTFAQEFLHEQVEPKTEPVLDKSNAKPVATSPVEPSGEVKSVCHRHLYIEDMDLIDVILAVIIANRLDCDPLWLLIVSASGNAKTELLRSMARANNIHLLSTLTGQTLVSGFRKNGRDPSLLPRLNGMTLVLKDFTSILSLPKDEKRKVFAQFRESHDGFFDASFGSEAGSVSYQSRFGLLGAVTPEIDRHQNAIQVLGERFLYYRPVMVNRKNAVEKARSNKGKEDTIRQEMSDAVCGFLNNFVIRDITCPPEIETKIETLAGLISWLRSNVSRDGYSREISYIPEPEIGTRLVKQFLSLAHGLALVRGKELITGEEYNVLCKTARDTLTNKKRLIFETLFMNKAGFKTTQEIGDMTNLPTETVKLTLEDYRLLGVCEREGTNEFAWKLRGEVADLVIKAEL